MNLSEVKTMDGVGLVEGGEYYAPACRDGVTAAEMYNHPVIAEQPNMLWVNGRPIFVVGGIAIGLWHSREVLEAGLGKGAQ